MPLPHARPAGDHAQKKRVVPAEQRDPDVAAQRQAWRDRQAAGGFDPDRLFFLDETYVRSSLRRPMARAPRGQRVAEAVPHKRWRGTTLLSVISRRGVEAGLVYDGGTDVAAVVTFAERCLGPRVGPGDPVILDNLAAHHAGAAVAALEATGARVLFLPPYSPDLSPIEPMFGKLKGYLRAALREAEAALWEWVGRGLDTITAADLAGWFRHCGYRNTQT